LHRVARPIEDYGVTAGRTRAWADDTNHAQLGDPAKAVTAMIMVATNPDPPLRLPLGADCVSRIETKLAHVANELDRCRAVALSTAHVTDRHSVASAALPT